MIYTHFCIIIEKFIFMTSFETEALKKIIMEEKVFAFQLLVQKVEIIQSCEMIV